MPFLTLDQAILLGALPYSFWVASLAGAARYKAARQTVGPASTAEEAKDQPAAADKKPSKLKRGLLFLLMLAIQLVIYVGTQAVIYRLPAKYTDRGVGAFMAAFLTSLAGPVLLDLVGQLDISLARFENGPLIAHSKLRWPHYLAQAVLFIALNHFLPAQGSVGQLAAYALAAFAIPVAISSCCVPQKVIALRWMVAFFLGCDVAAIVLVALCAVVEDSGLISKDALDSASDVITGGDAQVPAEDHDFRFYTSAFLLQPLFLAGLNGFLIATLYRLDLHLAAKTEGALALEQDDRAPLALLEPLPKRLGTKGPSGARVSVPSTHALVRTHFVAHHRGLFNSVTYAKLATFLAVATVAVCSVLANLFVKGDEQSPEGVDASLEAGVQSFLVQQTAMILFPWIVTLGVVCLALVRGEFKKVYGYREDWTAPKAELAAAISADAVVDEKTALVEEA